MGGSRTSPSHSAISSRPKSAPKTLTSSMPSSGSTRPLPTNACASAGRCSTSSSTAPPPPRSISGPSTPRSCAASAPSPTANGPPRTCSTRFSTPSSTNSSAPTHSCCGNQISSRCPSHTRPNPLSLYLTLWVDLLHNLPHPHSLPPQSLLLQSLPPPRRPPPCKVLWAWAGCTCPHSQRSISAVNRPTLPGCPAALTPSAACPPTLRSCCCPLCCRASGRSRTRRCAARGSRCS